jgi:hypothetical protein
MIKTQIKKAFNAVKDLASNVTLTQKNNTAYNFGTDAVTATSTVTKTIKGLLVEQKRQRNDNSQQSGSNLGSSMGMSFQFQSVDLQNPDIYDTITMANGDVWRMVPPYKDDGYIITVNVAKEA